ncbi:MAG: hypothetical protein JNJ70_09735 [Verrucomicrobiales bacterium]|nr:hypothetical protein [Verrucomicrobiales bacterium]
MKSKTELLLYRLFWLAEKPMRPTFRNIEQSFEGWAYQNGLIAQIERLESQGFLEAKRDPATGERLHRLTAAGRLAAGGGRDVNAAWGRKWDRRWRLLLFDVPECERSKRRKLTRALSAAGCGCLQGSVWIAPTTPPALATLMDEEDAECSQLLLLHAESKGKRVDEQMVRAAWNFEAINERYQEAIAVMDRFSGVASGGTRELLDEWTREESTAWRLALDGDPLLPEELLPADYLGREAWRRREASLYEAARLAHALGSERAS